MRSRQLKKQAQDEMWDVAQFQCLMTIAYSPFVSFILWGPVQEIAWAYIANCIITVLTLCLLMVFRHNKPYILSSLIYFFSVLTNAMVVLICQTFWLNSGLPFQPFLGIKFIAFLVALQAPANRIVGWGSLILLIAAPLFEYFLLPIETRIKFGVQEPWTTALAIGLSAVLYEQRLRYLKIVKTRLSLEISESELKRYTNLLLGAQHLINTPLQVIELNASMIKQKFPEANPFTDRILKAFEPIKEINHTLTSGKDRIQWQNIDLPDNIIELQKKISLVFPE